MGKNNCYRADIMRDPLARYPGYALRRAAHATAMQLSARLAEMGLKQVHTSILMLLDANPDSTASAIGRQLDIQRANMVPLLKKLEDAGWIARTPIDGKSQGLRLTENGRSTLLRARQVIEEFEADMLARVPAEHRDHLLPALDALWR